MNSVIDNIKYLVRKSRSSKINAFSAQTAFFMFLSLIPLVMIFLSMIKYLGYTETEIEAVATEFTPNAIRSFIDMYIGEIMDDSKLSLTIVSGVILLWSASKGVFAIIGGLNSVYEIKENRNYFLLRIHSMLYTIAFVVILCIALIIVVFGNKLNDFLYSLFPNIKSFVYIVSSLRFIIMFLMLTLFFALIYKKLPNAKMKFKHQIPGAIISSGGWVVFSTAFSFFVDNYSTYASIYGSLTTIIILMLWLYTCMYILFLGAEINLILSKYNTDKT